MKLGLIGGGYWGKNLIRDFNNCGVLDTICDINQEALEKYNELYPNVKTTKIGMIFYIIMISQQFV